MARTLRVLVVAAGGGSGHDYNVTAGGGGAGGFREVPDLLMPCGEYEIKVGKGGQSGQMSGTGHAGTNGEDSWIGDLLRVTGGGGGAGGATNSRGIAKNGGSGGGVRAGKNPVDEYEGRGIAGQGYDGSRTANSSNGQGGGGANGPGSGINPGGGVVSNITGSNVTYSQGGRGSSGSNTASTIPLNSGFGGNGTGRSGYRGVPTIVNGADGVVIIRYATAQFSGTGGVISTVGSDTVHRFTADGTFSLKYLPVTQISALTGLVGSTALCKAILQDTGSAEGVTQAGFVWSLTQHNDPGNITPQESDYENRMIAYSTSQIHHTPNLTEGPFEGALSGLIPGTTYYVRAWARNELGYAYSEEVQFVSGTSTAAPTISTHAADSVSVSSATFIGEIIDSGASGVTERGFVYGISSVSLPGNVGPLLSGYPNSLLETGDLFEPGQFSMNISGLNSGTRYFMRPFARNRQGFSYGIETYFDTQSVPYEEPLHTSLENQKGVIVATLTNDEASGDLVDEGEEE